MDWLGSWLATKIMGLLTRILVVCIHVRVNTKFLITGLSNISLIRQAKRIMSFSPFFLNGSIHTVVHLLYQVWSKRNTSGFRSISDQRLMHWSFEGVANFGLPHRALDTILFHKVCWCFYSFLFISRLMWMCLWTCPCLEYQFWNHLVIHVTL